MNTDEGQIHVEVHGGVGNVVLDRPSHRNALSRHMCRSLVEALAVLDAHPDVGVVAISGTGGDFCAGAGLDTFDEVLFDGAPPLGGSGSVASIPEPPEAAKAPDAVTAGVPDTGVDRLSEADAAIRAVRKPTVSLVEGICMGGGWQIAAAADLLIASTTARIAITPSKLGIIYPRSGLERLVDRVGLDRAKYLLLTAAEVTPRQAAEWGLITLLIPAEDFAEQAAATVRTIQSRSLFSTVTQKRLLDSYARLAAAPCGEGQEGEVGAYEADWNRSWADFRSGEDLAEGRRAFAAKEQPVFTWRLGRGQPARM
ncbi:enoyl-CoA hydratase [Citricoccus zhacaiensis]|uniref:Enoyl-CoA hydratase n=1 Tax=Citricoccus zhacaiensis TaxID=489142 RepID=A0ABQ2M5K8_9MICC|nr:enoyl-CoA hydratase/isomerase family protein [Citricoccus zhacaiensis]GGO47480.1 enoyl-CoA hydratase [Citricoccus zhacaiensis]